MNKKLLKYWTVFIPLSVLAIVLIYVIVRNLNSPKAKEEYVVGLVDAESVDLSSAMPGRIKTMHVKVGDSVQVGDTLAELDLNAIDLVGQQAADAFQLSQNNLQLIRQGNKPEAIQAAKNLEKIALDQVQLMRNTNARFQQLYQEDVVSGQEKELIEFRYKAAEKELENAKLAVRLLEQGANNEVIENARLIADQAKNAELLVQKLKDQTYLKAPASGIVTSVISQEGEMVNAGYPLVNIQKAQSIYFTFNLRQDLIATIQEGRALQVDVPGATPQTFMAVVSQLAPALGYADWIPESASGTFQLKTFNIKLYPKDRETIKGLRSGMSARLTITN